MSELKRGFYVCEVKSNGLEIVSAVESTSAGRRYIKNQCGNGTYATVKVTCIVSQKETTVRKVVQIELGIEEK